MGWNHTERRNRPGTDPITLDDLDEALEMHAQKERAYMKSMIDSVLVAFPSGDLAGHHDYHNRKILASQAEEEFWKAAKLTLIQAGVNGFVRLVWIVILLIALGLTVRFSMPDVFTKMLLALLGKG